MTRLTYSKFQLARKYLMENGRELEQQRFKFHFEKAEKDSVVSILKKHQNEDGGFQQMGEGEEFESSPIGTSIAFQYISELDLNDHEEMIAKGIHYILKTYDNDLKEWLPNQVNKANIHYKTGSGWANPSAELVGYLHKYSSYVPSDFLKSVTDRAMSVLSNMKDPLDCFETLCFLRMAKYVPEPYKNKIIHRISKGIFQVIETNPEKWHKYCAKPWWFADTPQSPLFESIADHVKRSLEYEIKTQSHEGNFILNWQIEGLWEKNWKSIWTMDALKALKEHRMIENIEN